MTKRILLVEDDEAHLQGIKVALESLGCAVDTATYIRAAIKLANENQYDLIVSDFIFPNFEGEHPERMGFELFRHLKHHLDVMPPFILHTSSDDSDVIAKAKELGAIYHYKSYGASYGELVELVGDKLEL